MKARPGPVAWPSALALIRARLVDEPGFSAERHAADVETVATVRRLLAAGERPPFELERLVEKLVDRLTEGDRR